MALDDILDETIMIPNMDDVGTTIENDVCWVPQSEHVVIDMMLQF